MHGLAEHWPFGDCSGPDHFDLVYVGIYIHDGIHGHSLFVKYSNLDWVIKSWTFGD